MRLKLSRIFDIICILVYKESREEKPPCSQGLALGVLFLESYCCKNVPLLLFAIFTSVNITGTSVSTPTVVARAAGLVVSNNATATATDNSKKFDAPIIPAGAAISWGSFSNLQAK